MSELGQRIADFFASFGSDVEVIPRKAHISLRREVDDRSIVVGYLHERSGWVEIDVKPNLSGTSDLVTSTDIASPSRRDCLSRITVRTADDLDEARRLLYECYQRI